MSPALRCAWALLAVLLLVLAAPLAPARAQSEAYTATVTVDATSDNAAKARDVARTDGARKALMAVIAKLVGNPDKVKPVKLNDNQVTDLVASFEVANEKMSASRYTADYTYHFKSNDVNRAIQSAGMTIGGGDSASASPGGALGNPAALPATAGGGKTVVVLPVYQSGDAAVLWDDPNPWRDAWSQRSGTGGGNLVVPLGDVSDLAAIDADKARAGNSVALAAIGKKEGADDVLVVIANDRTGDRPGVDVNVKRYRGGQLADVHFDTVDAKPHEADADLYRRAADAIAADLDNGWKNAKGGPTDQQGTLVAVVPISGLDDWLKLRDRLTAVPLVRKVDVRSLSRQEVTVEIQYAGGMDQLKTNLSAAKFDLQGGDPTWRLARSADKP